MTATERSVTQLNSFLRGEISAVETYRQALEHLKTTTHRQELVSCQQSHEQRAAILAEYIRQLGGTPAGSSGAWGAFTKLIEGGATALGEKAAITALEEGEDHGNRDYQSDLGNLDSTTRALIETRVLPLQRTSHATMSALKRQLS
ncbi:PA2169 family four-helix-bundle protein [Pendulispora brunnea]|uniref:PA2169 family four-helix-bundle protein n=1 Tax=Pendulispora brunnea TaxID=2905690 RepID=A0ABZ2KBC9_9BACT